MCHGSKFGKHCFNEHLKIKLGICLINNILFAENYKLSAVPQRRLLTGLKFI